MSLSDLAQSDPSLLSPARLLHLDSATLLRNIYAHAQNSSTGDATSDSTHPHTAPATQQSAHSIQHASASQPLSGPSLLAHSMADNSSAHLAPFSSSPSASSSHVAIPAALSAAASSSYPYAVTGSTPSLFHRPLPGPSIFHSAGSLSPLSNPQSTHQFPFVEPDDIEASARAMKRRDMGESSRVDSKRHRPGNGGSATSQAAAPHAHSAFTAVPGSGSTYPSATLASASFNAPSTPPTTAQQSAAPNASPTAQPTLGYTQHADVYSYYPHMYSLPVQGQTHNQSPAQPSQQHPQQPHAPTASSSSSLSNPPVSSLLSAAPPALPTSSTSLPSAPFPSILSISSAGNSLHNGVRVYPKYNDLLCCRHTCGCRRSKFDCSKSLPNEQLARLRQQHHDKLVRALMRQRAELSREQAQREVGDVAYLAGAAIIKRASRTQHEQNAALHTCGQQSENGKYVDYACRKLLKSNKQSSKASAANGKPSATAHSPSPLTPGQSLQLADIAALEEVEDEDSLLGLLYGAATKAMLSPRDATVPSNILRLVPSAVLQRLHMRGVALPFVQVPSSVGTEYLSSYWEGDSTVKLVQLPVDAERLATFGSTEAAPLALPEWARMGAAATHSKQHIATVRSVAAAAADEPCSAAELQEHIIGRPVGYGHMSQFLHQLALGNSYTYHSAWQPVLVDPNVKVAKAEQSVDLALHELTSHSNLLRLLLASPSPSPPSPFSLPPSPHHIHSSPSDLPAALSPHCTLLAGGGYRPLGCSALFSSAAVRLSPLDTGCLGWLIVPAAHRSRAEAVIAQEVRRHLSREAEMPADLPHSSLLALLYAGLVFIDPTLLLINGVPVRLVQQTAAHLFVHGGDMLLAGVVLGGSAVTLYEQPFLPVSWLRDGPTRCLHWLHWARNALAADSSAQSALRPTVRAAVGRLFPEPSSTRLFAALSVDIAAHLLASRLGVAGQQQEGGMQAQGSSEGKQRSVMDYSNFSEADLNQAVEALAACQAVLAQLRL